MEVGEEEVARVEHGDLGRLRLLDLDDHLGVGEDVGSRGDDSGADGLVVRVADGRSEPGTCLDQDLVAVRGQFTHPHRRDRHPVLLGLDLPRDANDHRASLATSIPRLPRPGPPCGIRRRVNRPQTPPDTRSMARRALRRPERLSTGTTKRRGRLAALTLGAGVAIVVVFALVFSIAFGSRGVAANAAALHNADEALRAATVARSQSGLAAHLSILERDFEFDAGDGIDLSESETRLALD